MKVMMKMMIEGMRWAQLSLVRPGYPEMSPSMALFFLVFSFRDKLSFTPKKHVHIYLSERWFAFRIKEDPTETKGKRKKKQKERAIDDDVVEDLVLSSDDDLPSSNSHSAGKNDAIDHLPPKQNKKQKRKQKHKTKRLKSHVEEKWHSLIGWKWESSVL